jgi:hypothetical protein
MNTRPNLSFPTPKPAGIPHRGKPSRNLPDLLMAVAAAAVIAAALFLFL